MVGPIRGNHAAAHDICDAVVVALAATLNAEVITGDRKDLRRLVTASGKRIRLHDA